MIRAVALHITCGTLLVAGWPADARAAGWKSDGSASRLEFVATFEGSAVPGVFKSFEARLDLDPERLAQSALDVSVRLASADLGIADVNREIAGATWFDYAAFPQARFRSDGILRVAGNRYVAPGTLALKGVVRSVEVPFTFVESGQGARIEGELTLDRTAFRIGTGEWAATRVVGAAVRVRFSVKLIPAE